MEKNEVNNHSYFSEIVKYINKLENDTLITRKDLVKIFPISSIDVYRRGLTLIGVLEDFDSGIYRKMNDIPPFINSSNLRDYSKDEILKEKMKYYYLTLERKKKLEEIFNY
jgi:hypothetical protein